MEALEAEALTHDTEHGFALLLAAGDFNRGWAVADRGQGEEGLAQMRARLASHREIGATVFVPAFLVLVAEVCQKLGRPAEGLAAVTEGLAVARRSGRHYWEAELHRVAGVLTLEAAAVADKSAERPAAPDGWADAEPVAESHFLQAIDIARRQRARSLELRTATSLARLWADQGKAREARALLSGVYAAFTEGFDSRDLQDARSLLDALAEP
jgi:adenylate cyclase